MSPDILNLMWIMLGQYENLRITNYGFCHQLTINKNIQKEPQFPKKRKKDWSKYFKPLIKANLQFK